FRQGDFVITQAEDGLFAFCRSDGKNKFAVAVNRGAQDASISLDGEYCDLLTMRTYCGSAVIPVDSAVILKKTA
ncbi:MAG: alpha amylase C-terminal domain-containing protein, partial [Corallococcus sp.]|nr:alpha amylase C-terminal domain-containing protein [Corallococcus sp.]